MTFDTKMAIVVAAVCYPTAELPLVGLAVRAAREDVNKIFKGAKLHE